jgi:hypothetical protein
MLPRGRGIIGAELVGDDRLGREALLSDSLRISGFPRQCPNHERGRRSDREPDLFRDF